MWRHNSSVYYDLASAFVCINHQWLLDSNMMFLLVGNGVLPIRTVIKLRMIFKVCKSGPMRNHFLSVIHSELLAKGVIPDYKVGENERQIQWVGVADWGVFYFFRKSSHIGHLIVGRPGVRRLRYICDCSIERQGNSQM